MFPYRGEIRILILGCGNSALSRDLVDDGYTNVVSLDYSRVCIESMRRLHATSHPGLVWVEGDVRDLPFPDSSFDLAIGASTCFSSEADLSDKGTLDALMALGPCVNALRSASLIRAAATTYGTRARPSSRACDARSTRSRGASSICPHFLRPAACSIRMASSCTSHSVSLVRRGILCACLTAQTSASITLRGQGGT